MLGWRNHKLESRLLGEISVTSDMQMTPPTLMAESEEELKSLLMKVKERNKVKSRSRVQLFANPWTEAYQVPPTMELKDTYSLEGKL